MGLNGIGPSMDVAPNANIETPQVLYDLFAPVGVQTNMFDRNDVVRVVYESCGAIKLYCKNGDTYEKYVYFQNGKKLSYFVKKR